MIPVVRSVGVVASGTAATALSPGAPAGKEKGDLLLMGIDDRGDNGAISVPGYTLLHRVVYQPSGFVLCLSVYRRIADGTAADTPASLTGHADHGIYRIMAIQGGTFDPVSPFGDSESQTTGDTGTAKSWPSLDTVRADSLILNWGSSHFGQNPTSVANANLSSLTQQMNNNTTAGGRGGLFVYSGGKAEVGNTGATTGTVVTGENTGLLSMEVKARTEDVGLLPTARVAYGSQPAGALYKGSTKVWEP